MKETGLQKYADIIIKSIHFIYKGDYFEHKKIQMITQKRLMPLYKLHDTNVCNIEHDVIYVADKYYGFGGLADRLRGIITLYDFCLSNNLSFGIYFNYPFQLSKYFVPNEIDWEVNCINRDFSTSYPLMIDTPSTLKTGVAGIVRYQRKRLQTILANKNRKQVHCYTNADLVTSSKRFAFLFNTLFRPSPLLAQCIDNCKRQIGEKYISVSFRFVQLLGDFKDCIDKTLSDKEQEILIRKCINAIHEIHLKHPTCKVLVTADSQKFLDEISDIEFVYIIPGAIAHLNYSEDDNAHLKTFVDFMMISSASKAYLVRTKRMFKSGFARKAAMSSDTPFEEYLIE